MKTLEIEMIKIDLKTGKRVEYVAEVANEKTDKHYIYSLTYEGYRSDWTVKSEVK
jgi:hypothetical protein